MNEVISWDDNLRPEHQQSRVAHWNAVALEKGRRGATGRAYHRRLAEVYRHLVAPGRRVLELGYGDGDLLAALEPAVGVGVDFSGETIGRARERLGLIRISPNSRRRKRSSGREGIDRGGRRATPVRKQERRVRRYRSARAIGASNYGSTGRHLCQVW